jgi:transcription elongation factor GreB
VSKAFTREDDSEESFAPQRAALPAGTQNYITAEGATKIQSELDRLLAIKRNSSAETPTPGTIENRIQYLQNLVKTFVVVERNASDVVRFGCEVVVDQNGSEERYRIVGVDEIDLQNDHISWLSPLARALMAKRVGDHVEFRAPAGVQRIRILSIH